MCMDHYGMDGLVSCGWDHGMVYHGWVGLVSNGRLAFFGWAFHGWAFHGWVGLT